MIGLLLEGVESLRLPCSWVLLLPGLGLSVYARRRSPLVISVFVAIAALVAWLRFSGWWFEPPRGITQVLIGVGLGGLVIGAWRADNAVTDAALGAASATAAVWSWIPCVGPELGALLNETPETPLAHAAGTAAHIIGLLLPFTLVAALDVGVPALRRRFEHSYVIAGGTMLLGLFALLYATTLLDDVAAELVRRSSF